MHPLPFDLCVYVTPEYDFFASGVLRAYKRWWLIKDTHTEQPKIPNKSPETSHSVFFILSF